MEALSESFTKVTPWIRASPKRGKLLELGKGRKVRETCKLLEIAEQAY